MRFIPIILLALCSASTLHAQRPTGRSVLSGTVRDAVTGGAPRRTQVCVLLPVGSTIHQRCAAVDTASAEYRIADLPQGRWSVGVSCGTILGFIAHGMASDSIAVAEGAPVRRDWNVSTTGCDNRPRRQVHGTFRGYYTPGFESSEFVPCAADAWFLLGDSLSKKPYDERRAWAVLQKGSLPEGFDWPDVPRNRHGSPRYYVHWRATVVGPGHYGHMGISPFEIRVDSVLTLRAPQRGDCRPLR